MAIFFLRAFFWCKISQNPASSGLLPPNGAGLGIRGLIVSAGHRTARRWANGGRWGQKHEGMMSRTCARRDETLSLDIDDLGGRSVSDPHLRPPPPHLKRPSSRHREGANTRVLKSLPRRSLWIDVGFVHTGLSNWFYSFLTCIIAGIVVIYQNKL